MIQLTTMVKICDKTGVVLGQCIKVLGSRRSRIAHLGDMFLLSVKRINVQRLARAKARIQRRYQRGTIHRGLLIRSLVNYQRQRNIFIRFNENAAIIVNRRRVPMSNRIYGPILREFTMRWP
jgi:large subunit ribosomal protein L14